MDDWYLYEPIFQRKDRGRIVGERTGDTAKRQFVRQ
jgi:hypothetical protein